MNLKKKIALSSAVALTVFTATTGVLLSTKSNNNETIKRFAGQKNNLATENDNKNKANNLKFKKTQFNFNNAATAEQVINQLYKDVETFSSLSQNRPMPPTHNTPLLLALGFTMNEIPTGLPADLKWSLQVGQIWSSYTGSEISFSLGLMPRVLGGGKDISAIVNIKGLTPSTDVSTEFPNLLAQEYNANDIGKLEVFDPARGPRGQGGGAWKDIVNKYFGYITKNWAVSPTLKQVTIEDYYVVFDVSYTGKKWKDKNGKEHTILFQSPIHFTNPIKDFTRVTVKWPIHNNDPSVPPSDPDQTVPDDSVPSDKPDHKPDQPVQPNPPPEGDPNNTKPGITGMSPNIENKVTGGEAVAIGIMSLISFMLLIVSVAMLSPFGKSLFKNK